MKKNALIEAAQIQIQAALEDLRYSDVSTADRILILRKAASKVLYDQRDVAPSDDLLESMPRHGSLVITCEFCDRTYFGDGGDYDEGEREELRAKAEKEPDKYIEQYDFINYGTINGKQFVFDCPCNGARWMEDWIWSHRFVIAKYFKRRAARVLDDAKDDVEAAETVAASVGVSVGEEYFD